MSSAAPQVMVGFPPELVEAIAARVAELLAPDRASSSVPEPWIGVEDAAAHLACRTHRIYDLVASGRLPHRKEGRRVLFRRSELDAYLDEGAGAP